MLTVSHACPTLFRVLRRTQLNTLVRRLCRGTVPRLSHLHDCFGVYNNSSAAVYEPRVKRRHLLSCVPLWWYRDKRVENLLELRACAGSIVSPPRDGKQGHSAEPCLQCFQPAVDCASVPWWLHRLLLNMRRSCAHMMRRCCCHAVAPRPSSMVSQGPSRALSTKIAGGGAGGEGREGQSGLRVGDTHRTSVSELELKKFRHLEM